MAKRAPAKKIGRPSLYTPELIERICERLETGEPLAQICRDDGMPGRRTVYGWIEARPEVAARVETARKIGFDAIAEECVRIADATDSYRSRDTVGGKVRDPQRDKLRVWTRLQLLAKWDPKRYGDRVQHANDPDNPLPAPQFIVQPVRAANE